jgi:hypothetical protein
MIGSRMCCSPGTDGKGIGDVEYFLVIAGLDPAIHLRKMMDARVKPAHD